MSSINGGFSGGGIVLKEGSSIPVRGTDYATYFVTYTSNDTFSDIITFSGRFAIAYAVINSLDIGKTYQFRIVKLDNTVIQNFEDLIGGSSNVKLLQDSTTQAGFIVLENVKIQARCVGDISTSDNFYFQAWEI